MAITIPVVAADGTRSTVTLADPMFRVTAFPFRLPAIFAATPPPPPQGYVTLPFQLPFIFLTGD